MKIWWHAILDGFGSLLDFSGSRSALRKRKFPTTNEEAFAEDARNLQKDWVAIGGDMRAAIKKFEEERADEEKNS